MTENTGHCYKFVNRNFISLNVRNFGYTENKMYYLILFHGVYQGVYSQKCISHQINNICVVKLMWGMCDTIEFSYAMVCILNMYLILQNKILLSFQKLLFFFARNLYSFVFSLDEYDT